MICRSYELIRAVIVVTNTALWALACDLPCWRGIYAGMLPVSAAVIIAELRSTRYHGIAAHRLNSQGPAE